MKARPTPVFQNIDIIAAHDPRYIIVLAGDHIYKMDYELMLPAACARRRGCDGRVPGSAAHGGDGASA